MAHWKGQRLGLFFEGEFNLEDNYWNILIVDDDEENCKLAFKYLNGKEVSESKERLKIDIETDFNKALEKLESFKYDFIILDVRVGSLEDEREEEEGIKALELIKAKKFLPVIFYTGLPDKVKALETPLVRVIENTEGYPVLLDTIKELLASKIPHVNREIMRHVDEVQRKYMWDFAAANWAAYSDTADKTSLAYLLARRLSRSLDGPGIQNLAAKLGDTGSIWCDEQNVHPMMYYVFPPLGNRYLAGDIFQMQSGEITEYAILITPSCTIVQGKADYMLFSKCTLLSETKQYREWKANPKAENPRYIDRLKNILSNHNERYFFLPSVFQLPDLVVDLQQTMTIEKSEFAKKLDEKTINIIASLDSPYSEEVVAQYGRYFGRLGTPDLNIDLVIDRLSAT